MENEDLTTKDVDKIYTLSDKEIGTLLREGFFKIGIKVTDDGQELKNFVDEVRHWQYNVRKDNFLEAFSEYAAGELQVKFKREFSNMFVSLLIKAHREKHYGKQEKFIRERQQFTNEDKFKLFFHQLNIYGSLPKNPDWIAIYNYFCSQHYIDAPEIPQFSAHSWKVAEREVTKVAHEKWGNMITDKVLYDPAKEQKGSIKGLV